MRIRTERGARTGRRAIPANFNCLVSTWRYMTLTEFRAESAGAGAESEPAGYRVNCPFSLATGDGLRI